MKAYIIRFSIHDAVGENLYDYYFDFLVYLDENPPGVSAIEYRKNLLAIFMSKVKAAVTEWFNTDKDTVISQIEQFGHGYDYENEAEEGQPELDYALSKFPARCVANIPKKIMEHHNFRKAPEADAVYHSYNDLGFLLDNN